MFEGVASVRYEASGRGILCFVTIFELYKSDSISLRDAIDVYLTFAPWMKRVCEYNTIHTRTVSCSMMHCFVFFFFFFFRNRNRLITNTFKQFAYMYKYVVHPCFVVSRTREFVVVASLTRVSRSIRPNWRLCSPPPGDSEREQFGAITRVDRTTISVISSSEIRLDRRTAGEICIWRKYTCLFTERPLRKKG